MKELGVRIGHSLEGGEIVELIGDVGAGKTTLTKGIAEGLVITEPIQSPSFTINRIYKAPSGLLLAHYDFYRLEEAGILAEEITEMMQDRGTVTVIEWAGAVSTVLPEDRLKISITPTGENTRKVDIRSNGTISRKLQKESGL